MLSFLRLRVREPVPGFCSQWSSEYRFPVAARVRCRQLAWVANRKKRVDELHRVEASAGKTTLGCCARSAMFTLKVTACSGERDKTKSQEPNATHGFPSCAQGFLLHGQTAIRHLPAWPLWVSRADSLLKRAP